MSELGPVDGELMRRMEAHAREIGRVIGGTIEQKFKGVGFAIMFFRFNGPEFTYISNAQRPDMIKLLEEILARWKSGEADQIWAERS